MSGPKRLITFFTPPPQWRIFVIILPGAFTGLAFYLLRISNATSYLSDDSQVCINCHIMTPQFAMTSTLKEKL